VAYGTKKLRSFAIFLGALAKLQKGAISFLMSAYLCVRMEQVGSHWADFHDY
jgi:hypothetical protein